MYGCLGLFTDILLNLWRIAIVGGNNLGQMQENFQIALITENMVPDIVYHLYSENLDIKLQCSLAIFKCASNKVGDFLLLLLFYHQKSSLV